jgi:diamine N-acetyltransferase
MRNKSFINKHTILIGIATLSLITGPIALYAMEPSSAKRQTPAPTHAAQYQIMPASEEDLEQLRNFWHTQWHETYRPYNSHDVLEHFFLSFFDLKQLKEKLNAGVHFIKVVDAQNHVIGAAIGEQRENNTLFISKMYIEKNHRGSGIGSRICQRLIEQCKPKHIQVIVQEDNPAGRRFFEKLGLKYETLEPKQYSFNGEAFNYFKMSKAVE